MAVERAISSETRSKTTTRPELSVAELAARQHGVVTRDQLIAIGFGGRAIDDRIARGLLHPIHRGVFAVGHRLRTRETTWIAAVLAAGPAATLSHRSAAALWGIRQSSRAVSDVIAPRKCRRAGIEAHRTALHPDEVTVRHGIPVTNAARTLFDLAAVVSAQQLDHALNEAEIRRLASPISLDAFIARHPRRKGTHALKRALDRQRRTGETVIRSDFETAFLDFTERYGLPRPKMNEPLGPYHPDAVWPDQRLVVELDSYDIHTTRLAFEKDRARDRDLQANGYIVLRVTWRQLTTDADEIAAQLYSLLRVGA